MTEPDVDVEQVIVDVLSAESEADDVIADPRQDGEGTEVDEADACGALDVEKPGAHGLGRAFDHDAWTFGNVDIRPLRRDHAAASRALRQRYWALAAIIRSRSAFVLHGEYDAAHQDHIHQDNVAPTRAFTTGSEAAVKLAQAVCKHIYGKSDLVIDGDFGPLSQAAVREAMITIDLPGDIFDNSQWERFLLRSARLGFELSLQ